jgi:hypothetical protein
MTNHYCLAPFPLRRSWLSEPAGPLGFGRFYSAAGRRRPTVPATNTPVTLVTLAFLGGELVTGRFDYGSMDDGMYKMNRILIQVWRESLLPIL